MADGDLDQAVRRADPDRWLASRFIADRKARADVVALYAYDFELARAGRLASNHLIAEIRLTWWREALDEIFAGRRVRSHPVAERLAVAVASHRLPRAPFEAMIDGRIAALDGGPLGIGEAERWADAVGGSATELAARVLDPATAADGPILAGRVWGLELLRRAGMARGDQFDRRLGESIFEADDACRRLSVVAFPAVICATLARGGPRTQPASELKRRLRLFWAVARGRI